MSSTIMQYGSTQDSGVFANARHIDRLTDGTLWAMAPDRNEGVLEFHYSTNNGATWTQLAWRRIYDARLSVGHSMRIGSAPDGQQRIAIIYRDDDSNKMKIRMGYFKGSTYFKWHPAGAKDVSKGEPSGFYYRPDLEILRLGDQWVIPGVWTKWHNSQETARIILGRVRYTRSECYAGQLQDIDSGGNVGEEPHPSLALRHLGDDVFQYDSSPDLYTAWGLGAATDASRSTHMLRSELNGYDWSLGQRREVEPDGTYNGLISSCFTGQRYATVHVPSGETSDLVLHLMTPADTGERERFEVPEPGLGVIEAVTITWDNPTADIWIIASGASTHRPFVIKFDWGTRQWGPWTQVNTDVVVPHSLNAKPGSKGSRIEFSYFILSGGTTHVMKYELAALSNVPPYAPTWITEQGAKDVNASLVLSWLHSDLDGDPQVQYELRRSVAGVFTYWNGTSWQAGSVQPTGATNAVTLSPGWASEGDTITYAVRTNDGQVWSEWSVGLTVLGSVKSNPVITAPAPGSVLTAFFTAQWSVVEQTAWRLVLLHADDSAIYYDTGWVGEGAQRYHTPAKPILDGESYYLQVITQNNEGLISTPAQILIDAALEPPPDPVVTLAPNVSGLYAAIDVAVANGSAGAGQQPAELNYAYRYRTDDPDTIETLLTPEGFEADTTFTDHTVAAGVDYGYRVEAASAPGTRSTSGQVEVFV